MDHDINDWAVRNVFFNGENFKINLRIHSLNKPDEFLFNLNLGKFHIEQLKRILKLYEVLYPGVLDGT